MTREQFKVVVADARLKTEGRPESRRSADINAAWKKLREEENMGMH